MKPATVSDRLVARAREIQRKFEAGELVEFEGKTEEEIFEELKRALHDEMPRMVPAQRPADVSEPDMDRLRENLRRAQEDAARRNDDD